MHTVIRHRTVSRGFTLVEVLVVVVILGVLAAVIVPRVMDRPDEARKVRAAQDVAAIVSALNMYRLDNYSYPSSEQGLRALAEKPPGVDNWRDGGYLSRVPKDPWNREYLYQNPGQHGEIDVWTYGADGQPGGERANGDVGNWQP
ncbi:MULTISPECIES: type II secretion system major pseudopilin GspG [unclassified Rhodanobacter]|uniref:type II secretion system major pseudopilin GspG n=1 Tax=unclassified Rhodanobacter TaxID=2621553 RepID=UPI001BDEAA9A|nr:MULTISPECIES: type II secretion system major pseudopilin GspG [unclassified Rhodanobacter]MBT2143642.1 type II secretion system major pseudopilin GspG [Rhodanobacter sp. LX-99]MBT2147284.1 type II secretion system major pseudopilin GspG [Rhodanobacter sp. LX-100]